MAGLLSDKTIVQGEEAHHALPQWASESVSNKRLNLVTPTEVGVQKATKDLDSGFRRNDVG
jgi:hypothetical protein